MHSHTLSSVYDGQMGQVGRPVQGKNSRFAHVIMQNRFAFSSVRSDEQEMAYGFKNSRVQTCKQTRH